MKWYLIQIQVNNLVGIEAFFILLYSRIERSRDVEYVPRVRIPLRPCRGNVHQAGEVKTIRAGLKGAFWKFILKK